MKDDSVLGNVTSYGKNFFEKKFKHAFDHSMSLYCFSTY